MLYRETILKVNTLINFLLTDALFLFDFDIKTYAYFYQFLKHFPNIVMILCHCCVFLTKARRKGR